MEKIIIGNRCIFVDTEKAAFIRAKRRANDERNRLLTEQLLSSGLMPRDRTNQFAGWISSKKPVLEIKVADEHPLVYSC
jgi:hypothetical protein